MARIVGVDLHKNKPVHIALTYIFGIGRTSAKKILEEASVDGAKRVKDLSVTTIETSADSSPARWRTLSHKTLIASLPNI